MALTSLHGTKSRLLDIHPANLANAEKGEDKNARASMRGYGGRLSAAGKKGRAGDR
jgi:hypothetical protein